MVEQQSSVDPWKGVCFDDGTGRNLLFVDENGQRQRKVPPNFVPERFINDERRYYFRGVCIRCRTPSPSVFLTRTSDYVGYCLNYCAACTAATLGDSSTGIAWKGDAIWQANIDTPKHMIKDLKESACGLDRDLDLIKRAKDSKFDVRTAAKERRNRERAELVKQKALEYNVLSGELISWGFENEYDEYFGELDKNGYPDGHGVKFYSDGSIYVGGWHYGQHHTLSRSMWQRPDGSQYEGTWQHGMKHGVGIQIFPDGSRYSGEFAKGYEHGHGTKRTPDGSVFEGRFRFGKKDGPGVLTTPDGQTERRVFRESDVFHERPVPEIVEVLSDADRKFFEPESLMQLSITALAKAMHKHRHLVPPALLHRRLPAFMKEWVARKFLLTIYPKGTQAFIDTAPEIAFTAVPKVDFTGVRFAHFDCESLLYFTSANSILQALHLSMNRLDPASQDLINRKLLARTWPQLHTLDISFNRMDVSTVRNLINAAKNNRTLRVLKLAGCNINPAGADIVAKYLENNTEIVDLDMSFNVIQAAGAESFAEAITKNNTLTLLNLRCNSLGSIGGQALADAMRYNDKIQELCIVDNKVGFDVMTLLAGRLRGSASQIAHCVRAGELEVPAIHLEKKDWHVRS